MLTQSMKELIFLLSLTRFHLVLLAVQSIHVAVTLREPLPSRLSDKLESREATYSSKFVVLLYLTVGNLFSETTW